MNKKKRMSFQLIKELYCYKMYGIINFNYLTSQATFSLFELFFLLFIYDLNGQYTS